jgi:hypothetical protein
MVSAALTSIAAETNLVLGRGRISTGKQVRSAAGSDS